MGTKQVFPAPLPSTASAIPFACCMCFLPDCPAYLTNVLCAMVMGLRTKTCAADGAKLACSLGLHATVNGPFKVICKGADAQLTTRRQNCCQPVRVIYSRCSPQIELARDPATGHTEHCPATVFLHK